MSTTALTIAEKQKIRDKAEHLNDKGLLALAKYCEEQQRPDAAMYVHALIEDREIQRKVAAVPLVVNNRASSMSSPDYRQREKAIIEPATFNSLKPALTVVSVVGIGGLVGAYVVIPAIIAIGTAVVSFVSFIAPFLAIGAAVVAGLFVAVGMFSGGEKKTDYPQSGGPRIVNIHINQGDQVNINQG